MFWTLARVASIEIQLVVLAAALPLLTRSSVLMFKFRDTPHGENTSVATSAVSVVCQSSSIGPLNECTTV